MIVLLDNEQRKELDPIFEREFNSALPDESQANIVAVVDDGIEAFVTVEALLRVGMIWIRPDKRSEGHLQALTRHLFEKVPRGSSVITIATEAKQGKYFKRLGMREISGRLFRIDL